MSSREAQRSSRELLQWAVATWPNLGLDAEQFVTFLESRRPEWPAQEQAPEEASGQAADLYLAWGCSQGNARALAAFHQTHHAEIERIARRFESAYVDDLCQLLREKLFVALPGEVPKIAQYSGAGRLKNWLRVTAIRTFLDEVRRRKRLVKEVPMDPPELQNLPDEFNLELEFLKRQYSDAFKGAFVLAVSSLTSRERNLLRHQILAGLNIDQIAAIYAIHRATAARRLAKARQTLLDATRKELTRSLELDRPEFERVMRLIQSRLDVSLHRLFSSDHSLIRSTSRS